MTRIDPARGRALSDALVRQNFLFFLIRVFMTLNGGQPFNPAYYVEVMADWMTAAADGDIRRLIVSLPPRHLKSICVSVAWTAWMLGRDPAARITCISYSDELAAKHARDCLKVMNASWYRRVFPGTKISRKRSATTDFETTRGGGRLATSVGGTLTGRGGDYIIVDDPIKPEDARSRKKRTSTNQWFDHTVYSRFDSPERGVLIIVMQRVHPDDLVGHVTEKEHWDQLCFPAIATEDEVYTLHRDVDVGRKIGEALDPDRISLEELGRIRNNIGTFAFEAQYQQCPVPEAGNLIRREWFWIYDEVPPARAYGDRTVQSWDTAISINDTADWSVCTTWAVRGEDYYLLDIYRERIDFPTLKNRVVEMQKRYDASFVLIEDEGAASALIQSLKVERLLHPIGIRARGSKEDRMIAQSAVVEAGRVHLPRSASWLAEFMPEVIAFPAGRHDDQIDSMSQFLNWIARSKGGFQILHVRV
jgi:predicted phage terminase large subunit-like protein